MRDARPVPPPTGRTRQTLRGHAPCCRRISLQTLCTSGIHGHSTLRTSCFDDATASISTCSLSSVIARFADMGALSSCRCLLILFHVLPINRCSVRILGINGDRRALLRVAAPCLPQHFAAALLQSIIFLTQTSCGRRALPLWARILNMPIRWTSTGAACSSTQCPDHPGSTTLIINAATIFTS